MEVNFNETEDCNIPNNVFTFLLGDILQRLKETTDETFYDHYSLIAFTEVNWNLYNLGRNDCVANAFSIVADRV